MRRFELIPLKELGGRPRIDVLCNMSGIFRDSFQNVVELLDDLFQRAADADEPEDVNLIRQALTGSACDSSLAQRRLDLLNRAHARTCFLVHRAYQEARVEMKAMRPQEPF